MKKFLRIILLAAMLLFGKCTLCQTDGFFNGYENQEREPENSWVTGFAASNFADPQAPLADGLVVLAAAGIIYTLKKKEK